MSLRQTEKDELRSEHYNATVVSIERCHDELMIVRVQPDHRFPLFHAGQYTLLGLGYWEARAPACQPEDDNASSRRQLIKRAYSISCPMLAHNDQVVGVNDLDFVEFYVTLIRQADLRPPALTPRLFALERGSRIFCDPHVRGHYVLENVPHDATVIFAATGTGEAPHNAMIAQLLKEGHRGPIANVSCVRWQADLGYLVTHRRLEARFPHYCYFALTTREPENVDASRPDFVGKRYLQDYFSSGDFEAESKLALDPENTHVFLCGNPQMIGAPLQTGDSPHGPALPQGMVAMLEARGFRIDRPHQRGNIHFEKYW